MTFLTALGENLSGSILEKITGLIPESASDILADSIYSVWYITAGLALPALFSQLGQLQAPLIFGLSQLAAIRSQLRDSSSQIQYCAFLAAPGRTVMLV